MAALAHAIWHEHYAAFLSRAQIDFMLAGRYTPEDLAACVDQPDRWFEVLRIGGEPTGFLRCVHERPAAFRLAEIYLARAHRGQGHGQQLLVRAETLARDAGCDAITLYVNRRNALAIQAYRRAGYHVRSVCDVEIGGGFVMADYLMEKPLPAQEALRAAVRQE
ncbi:MAG: GNAT family N-acetyltransferase [Gammaproteobacteria bacterium]